MTRPARTKAASHADLRRLREDLELATAALKTHKTYVAARDRVICDLERDLLESEAWLENQRRDLAELRARPVVVERHRERERLPDERESVAKRFQLGNRCERDFESEVGPLVRAALSSLEGPALLAAEAAILALARTGAFERITGSGCSALLHIGHFSDGRPGEMFLRLERAERGGIAGTLANAFATMVSIAWQYGVPLEAVVSKLEFVRDDSEGFTVDPEDRHASSLLDAIANWLRRRYLAAPVEPATTDAPAASATDQGAPHE